MLWFDGSIRNAVDKVKSSGVVLLVFVQGDDTLSKKYESLLNEESKFKPQDYVAIKISHDSFALKQFKEIYITVPIPSLFVIGNNGVPMKIVTSEQTSDILNAINDALVNQEIKQKEKSEILGIEKAISKKCLEKEPARTSQHIKNVGCRLLDITEAEIRQRLKEIRGFPRFLPFEPSDPCHPSPMPKLRSARIQFRLPNNEMPSWEFPDLSTLADVRAYLMEKIKLSSNFKLLRSYPRAAFTLQDEDKTLKELSLTPRATLIVVPFEHESVQAKVRGLITRKSIITVVLNSLLQPFWTVLNFFKKRILGENINNIEPKRLVSDTSIEKILNKKTSTSNIHGFKFDEDTDTDSEHPDNGNSTQQRFHK